MAHDAERIGGRVPVVFVRVVPVGRRVICTGEGTDETVVADALAKPSVAAATLLRLWVGGRRGGCITPVLLPIPPVGPEGRGGGPVHAEMSAASSVAKSC